ncbi:unnamed protein product, partial [Bubo scandiacus]
PSPQKIGAWMGEGQLVGVCMGWDGGTIAGFFVLHTKRVEKLGPGSRMSMATTKRAYQDGDIRATESGSHCLDTNANSSWPLVPGGQ